MRIFLTMLTIALLAAWSPIAPAHAQCEPTECSGLQTKAKAAKSKPQKITTQKAKKPQEQYMKAAN